MFIFHCSENNFQLAIKELALIQDYRAHSGKSKFFFNFAIHPASLLVIGN